MHHRADTPQGERQTHRHRCFVITTALSVVALAWLPATALAAETVRVQHVIPYAQESRVAPNVREECHELGAKLSKFLVRYAKKRGMKMEQVLELDPSADGINLLLEITDAISQGNGFTGHQKYMEARAQLYVDGVRKAERYFRRNSMGGAYSLYKSSCAVLGRNSKALGRDFATWLSGMKGEMMR